MHAHRATTATKLTAADLDRLIARHALPPGTHTARHPAEFTAAHREAHAPAPAESFARLSPGEQAKALDRAHMPGGAPHQWLDTDRAGLDPALDSALDPALDSAEGCAAPADGPRDAAVIHAFDVTVEPWAHTYDRALDSLQAGVLGVHLRPVDSRWTGRTQRPTTPMADATHLRLLHGSAARDAAALHAMSRDTDAARRTLPGTRREALRAAWRPPRRSLVTAFTDALAQRIGRAPLGVLLIGAAAIVAAIAASSLAPWGFALPVLEQPAAAAAASTGGAR